MTVTHSTLLSYLGKQISFKYPVPVEYNSSCFEQISGQVISVLIVLNENHQLCVLHDEKTDSADFFECDQMIFME